MAYGAITLDNNIFKQNGYRFESGILRMLEQFRNSEIDFMLSDVIISEMRKHISDPISKTLENLNSNVNKAYRVGLLSDEGRNTVAKIILQGVAPLQIAQARIDMFLEMTGGKIIDNKRVPVSDLMDKYFGTEPPFEEGEKKKNEFPDAVALIALEKWAEKNDKKILAVSNDKGWAAFAEQSDWIDVEKELNATIEKLIEPEEMAVHFLQRALTEVDSGRASEVLDYFVDNLQDAVSEIDAFSEASSDFHLIEPDETEITFQDFKFLKKDDEEYAAHIVSWSDDEIVAEIALNVDAEITCDFSMSAWDSIDKEYVHMTSVSANTEEKFDVSVLVTFAGNFLKNEYEITNLEISDAPNSFDFGCVEPDDSFYR